MLKKTIATGIAVAVLAGAAACGPDDETAAVDDNLTTIPADTTTLGVPGGTLGTTPGTMPADTLGGRAPLDTTIPPATP